MLVTIIVRVQNTHVTLLSFVWRGEKTHQIRMVSVVHTACALVTFVIVPPSISADATREIQLKTRQNAPNPTEGES